VRVVRPLTRVTLAFQGPLGTLLGGANVMVPDWPGARVMICCARKGPAPVLPGPSDRRTVPFRSTARPPVFSTWTRMDGRPRADRCPVTEAMVKFVGGAPPCPTAR
jgi:hypothetical protein